VLHHGRGAFATGQLLRVSLDGSSAQLVNAAIPGRGDCATASRRR
jgi:hypothetical protein